MRTTTNWAWMGIFLLGCSANGTKGGGGSTTATGAGTGSTSGTAGTTGVGGAPATTTGTGTGTTSATGPGTTSATTGTNTGATTSATTGTASTTSSTTSTGALMSTPGKVDCGNTTCNTPGAHCCLGGANGPACSMTDCAIGDTTFACDQEADCPANTVCCFQGFNGPNHYEEARCLTPQQCQIQLCGTQAECPMTKPCTPQTCFGQGVQSCGGVPTLQCP